MRARPSSSNSSGSEGATACSLGREPQEGGPKESQSPEGATAARLIEETAVALSGLLGGFVDRSLGLTPQATCRCPSGAGAGVSLGLTNTRPSFRSRVPSLSYLPRLSPEDEEGPSWSDFAHGPVDTATTSTRSPKARKSSGWRA